MEDENAKIEENFKELLSEVSKIGEIIEEVEADEGVQGSDSSENAIITTPITYNDENIKDYAYSSATKLIDNSLSMLDRVKKSVTSVMDFRELTALADLIKATTSSIETLNKVIVENEKIKSAKEIKKMDIESKKELNTGKIKNQTNNILVASREEILQQLVDKTINTKGIIEAETIEIDDENDK